MSGGGGGSGGRPNFNQGAFGGNNMMDDSTTAPILLGVSGGLLFISITLLIARLWSRLRPTKSLQADDWLILGGTVLAIANYSIIVAAVGFGLGRRTRFVSFRRRRQVLTLIFISQTVWYWAITLVKLSVAALLFRVKRSSRPWRIFIYILMTILVLAALVQTAFQFLQCRPFSVYWDPRVFRSGPVKCFKRSVINGNIVAFSSLQVATDLMFSFIPITFIRKLNVSRREKIFMCILMGLGLFASCAAIVRTMTLQEFYVSRDVFRTNVTVTLWAAVEQQFATIAATLPTLKAFFENVLLRIGAFFYDEKTETEVRGKLVAFGLLGEGDQIERPIQRKPSLLDTPTPRSERKMRDEYGDTIMGKNSEEVDDVMAKEIRAIV
ncbi:hypothetical protein B0J11DRAFT_501962 [Dendryphion nanum]|uniref:Rhodopsin domain-containing protein n=1 Tax=Dendryphion nanum TaxID=256645 RepID=A0A9P9EEL2_9PLEO|nr:hypothetical protein B0J11DRAFT_501962 [Dendryphion nanum]